MSNRLLSVSDLGGPGGRWLLSREGARQWSRRPDFPRPIGTIGRHRSKVWTVEAIAAFEELHPELIYADAKRAKARLAWCGGYTGTVGERPAIGAFAPSRPWPWPPP